MLYSSINARPLTSQQLYAYSRVRRPFRIVRLDRGRSMAGREPGLHVHSMIVGCYSERGREIGRPLVGARGMGTEGGVYIEVGVPFCTR